MPSVPYQPVPDVAPSTSQPSNYFTQQANPADFGSQIGQATEGLGKSIEQVGDVGSQIALQRQVRVNNVAQDDAFNKFQQGSQNLLYGDPDKPGDQGYYGLHGQAAVDARPAVLKQIEDLRTGIKGGLGTEAQQLGFDEASRRLSQYSAAGVGSHSEQEFNRYAIETQNAGIDIKARAVANGYNDDELFKHNLSDALRAADAASALSGADPNTDAGRAVFADKRAQASQTIFTARAVAMGTADPVAGAAYLKANPDKFDAITYRKLTDEFKGGDERAQVAAGINDVMRGGGGGASSGVRGAILGQEASGPNAVSVDGARGRAQIIEGTFNQYKLPGESFSNEPDRRAAANRYLDDLSQRYNGDAARIAVGYFSGPGNVSPAGSATPWINDAADGNGTRVSSYVAGFKAKLAAQPAVSAPDTGAAPAGGTHNPAAFGFEQQQMDAARTQAQARFPNRPDLQRQLVEGVYQQIAQTNALQGKYQAEQARQLRDNQEADGQRIVKSLMLDPAHFDPATIARSPSLTYEQKISLWKLSESTLASGAEGKDVNKYGSAFSDLYQQVHAPDGDKSKITDPSILYPLVKAGTLTVSGVDKLTQEIQGARTAEGAAEGKMKAGVFDALKLQVSAHGFGQSGRDPIGEQLWGQAQIALLQAYDEGRKGGKSAAQLLDAKSPDYVGKVIGDVGGPFLRTAAQKNRDFFLANQPDHPGGLDLPSAAGGRPAASAAPIYTRADLEAEMRRRKLLPAASVDPAPAAPH